MEFRVKILAAVYQNRSIRHFVIEKPEGYTFEPGQSTEVSLDQEKSALLRRAFSFTGIPDTHHLEFMARLYPVNDPFSMHLSRLQPGDYITIRPAGGTLRYKGPGYFIAGGTGVTPFISILRHLEDTDTLAGNQLIYSARGADVIMERELRRMLGNNFFINYTNATGRIDKTFIDERITSIKRNFYICGPDLMVENVKASLLAKGVPECKLVYETCYNLNESLYAA
jgi:ferredoxin-NADP reductase